MLAMMLDDAHHRLTPVNLPDPVALAAGVPPQVTAYPLAEANQALDDLRRGAFSGVAVLVVADQVSTR